VIRSLNGRALIIGVDRLDYSKGIAHRLSAFELFLQTQPDWRGKVTYLQIAPKSRSEIPEIDVLRRRRQLTAGIALNFRNAIPRRGFGITANGIVIEDT